MACYRLIVVSLAIAITDPDHGHRQQLAREMGFVMPADARYLDNMWLKP